jgi:hypothetical protein
MDLILNGDTAEYNEGQLTSLLDTLGYGVALRETYYDKNKKITSETVKCGHLAHKYPFCITSNLTLGTAGVIMVGQGQEKVLLAESKLALIDLITAGVHRSFIYLFMEELQRTFDKAQASANRSN